MDAAAKDKLEEIIRGRNPVTVRCVAPQAPDQEYPMVPSIVRLRFQWAREVQVTAEGVGALQADGNWLFVNDQS